MTRAKDRGWWVDESVPDLTDVLPASMLAAEFAAWLGPRLGRYRSEMEARAALGAPEDDRAAVALALRLADETRSALDNLPPRLRAILQSNSIRDAEKIGATWGELTRRICDDLLLAGALLRGALLPQAKRGRKAVAARDELMAAIAGRLREGGASAGEAKLTAAEMLVRCRIPSPADHDAIKRAMRRGQKLSRRSGN